MLIPGCVKSASQEDIAQIARTIPLLARFAVFHVETGALLGSWSQSGVYDSDLSREQRLLLAGESAIHEGARGSTTITVSGRSGSVVVARVSEAYAVALGFDEILSFDWTNYYMQRAIRRTVELLDLGGNGLA